MKLKRSLGKIICGFEPYRETILHKFKKETEARLAMRFATNLMESHTQSIVVYAKQRPTLRVGLFLFVLSKDYPCSLVIHQ
jgi:hypothetical protein